MRVHKFLARRGLANSLEASLEDRRSVPLLAHSLPDSASCATLHEWGKVVMYRAVWIWWAARAGWDRERLHDEKKYTVPIIMGRAEILRNSMEESRKKKTATKQPFICNTAPFIIQRPSICPPSPPSISTQKPGLYPRERLERWGKLHSYITLKLIPFLKNNE